MAPQPRLRPARQVPIYPAHYLGFHIFLDKSGREVRAGEVDW